MDGLAPARVFESFPIFLRQQQQILETGLSFASNLYLPKLSGVLKLFAELISRARCFGAEGLIKSRGWEIYGVGILAARFFDQIRSNASFSVHPVQSNLWVSETNAKTHGSTSSGRLNNKRRNVLEENL